MKKTISEEMELQKEWYKEAEEMTLERLPTWINELLDNYNHDYGTICHAIASGAIATMWAMNNHKEQGGITGFQAGCILWKIIINWSYKHNKTGLRLIDYDNMLYPQYEDKFEKTLTKNTWDAIKEEATNKLKSTEEYVDKRVIKHWESIANGEVPFGYKVEEVCE